MKTVGNFNVEDPRRCSEQLDRFQDNVENETKDIRATFMPAFEPIVFTPATSTLDSTLLVSQIALCDTTAASVTVTLSAGRLGQPGFLALVKRSVNFSLFIRPSGLSAPNTPRLIDNTSGLTKLTAGLYLVYFDGLNWWSN